MSKASNQMLDIIRDMVIQELNSQDNIILCQVVKRKDATHYDIVDVADESTVIRDILNVTMEDLDEGSYAYLYKIQNNFAQSFIVSPVLPYVNREDAAKQAFQIQKRVASYNMGYRSVDGTSMGYPVGGTGQDFISLVGYEEEEE